MSDERPAVERVKPSTGLYARINKVMVTALSSPRLSRRLGQHLLLLHVTGRRSGRVYSIPLAHHLGPQGTHTLLTSAPWRVNLRDHPRVEVTYLGERRAARAELVEDPVQVARTYRDLIEKIGHTKAGSRLGIRINVDRTPTLEELEDAVRRDHLSVIRLGIED